MAEKESPPGPGHGVLGSGAIARGAGGGGCTKARQIGGRHGFLEGWGWGVGVCVNNVGKSGREIGQGGRAPLRSCAHLPLTPPPQAHPQAAQTPEIVPIDPLPQRDIPPANRPHSKQTFPHETWIKRVTPQPPTFHAPRPPLPPTLTRYAIPQSGAQKGSPLPFPQALNHAELPHASLQHHGEK